MAARHYAQPACRLRENLRENKAAERVRPDPSFAVDANRLAREKIKPTGDFFRSPRFFSTVLPVASGTGGKHNGRMKTYLVGGAVRDRLLGLPVKDRDYVVVGST